MTASTFTPSCALVVGLARTRDLEAEALVESDCGIIVGCHLEKQPLHLGASRRTHQPFRHVPADATPLPFGRDADREDLRLVGRDAADDEAGQGARLAYLGNERGGRRMLDRLG